MKKSTIIPILLLVYLCVMAYIGYPAYKNGQTSALQYFGVTAATIVVIILIHFSLKRHERLRQERLDKGQDDNTANQE
jgi:Na+/H+ antiporter NhaC